MTAGDRWYGVFTIGSDAANPGNIGTIPVDLRRYDDDVTKTADVTKADVGDIVTYTITVEPNVTGEDLTYALSDTIPAGMTYVPDSVTGGAVYSGGEITWNGVMSGTPYYAVTTDASDPLCDTGYGGYVNLAGFGINPQSGISGDSKAWTAFSAQNPYVFFGQSYTGLGFTDDGFLVFNTASNWPGTAPWINQELPDPALPNNVAAMLWQDMNIVYSAGTRGVSLATDGPWVTIVEYDDIEAYGSPTDTYDFEAVVYGGLDNDPGMYEMVFAYDNLVGDLSNVTIGLENALGNEAYTFVNQEDASALIQDGTMICFDYVPPTEPHVITYQVEVTTPLPAVITNTVTNSVTQLGAMDMFVSEDVWVNFLYYFMPIVGK